MRRQRDESTRKSRGNYLEREMGGRKDEAVDGEKGENK
jgi:hypothetical protein